MKKLVVLAVLVLAGGLVAPLSAVAGDTICPPAIVGGTHDNILVPPGASCSVSGATVNGNIKALENSKLVVSSSTVRGNIDGDKADLVQVNFSIVRGNIQIKEGGPAAPPFPAGAFFCGVGAACEALVFGTTVLEGNVQIEKMAGSVAMLGSTIEKGNVKTEENFIPAGDFLSNASSSIAQDLQVFKNSGPGAKTVIGNTVGENLQCKENTPPFAGGPNVAGKAEGQCF